MKGFLVILFFAAGMVAYIYIYPLLPQDDVSSGIANDPYVNMRALALETTASQVGIEFKDDSLHVFGMAMDWIAGGSPVTLVSYSNGDAALYFQGGGELTPGDYENVRGAAKKFVAKGDSLITRALPSMEAPLPQKDTVNFWFLTTGGRFLAKEAMRNFGDTTLQWGNLFMRGNEVMMELRTVETLNALEEGK